MNVLMATPHLPPHQAANALLPHLVGEALAGLGHDVRYLTFGDGPDTGRVAHVRRATRRLRGTRLPQALEAWRTWRKGLAMVRAADVVHVHSNTWVNQVVARLARRERRPYVLTHYGTEIWHHDGKDRAFRELNRGAAHVTFYSHALLARARELAVPLPAASVVYPPVADAFHPLDEEDRRALRQRYGVRGPWLLNVKRLHPLADQSTLLEAFAAVRARCADATLFVAGSGESGPALREKARALGLLGEPPADAVRFLGLVPNDIVAKLQAAADLFVLSSVLEATPTVVLEGLACGTPAVSTDNPGGLELHAIFGDDVAVVPRQDPGRLAEAVLAFVGAPRRASPSTASRIAAEFRLPGVVETYVRLYHEARGGRP